MMLRHVHTALLGMAVTSLVALMCCDQPESQSDGYQLAVGSGTPRDASSGPPPFFFVTARTIKRETCPWQAAKFSCSS